MPEESRVTVTLYKEKNGWREMCSMCRKMFRNGDVLVRLSSRSEKKYHRLCLKHAVESTYHKVGLQPFEDFMESLDATMVTTDKVLFERYRAKLAAEIEEEEQ